MDNTDPLVAPADLSAIPTLPTLGPGIGEAHEPRRSDIEIYNPFASYPREPLMLQGAFRRQIALQKPYPNQTLSPTMVASTGPRTWKKNFLPEFATSQSSLEQQSDEDTLRLENGAEKDFQVSSKPFPFTPCQSHKHFNPKALSTFKALSGLSSLEKCYESSASAGLSVDKTRYDRQVSLEDATCAVSDDFILLEKETYGKQRTERSHATVAFSPGRLCKKLRNNMFRLFYPTPDVYDLEELFLKDVERSQKDEVSFSWNFSAMFSGLRKTASLIQCACHAAGKVYLVLIALHVITFAPLSLVHDTAATNLPSLSWLFAAWLPTRSPVVWQIAAEHISQFVNMVALLDLGCFVLTLYDLRKRIQIYSACDVLTDILVAFPVHFILRLINLSCKFRPMHANLLDNWFYLSILLLPLALLKLIAFTTTIFEEVSLTRFFRQQGRFPELRLMARKIGLTCSGVPIPTVILAIFETQIRR